MAAYVHNVEQIAVCNLASIALNRYVTADRKFDFKQLEYVTSVVVRNLNKIIEINYYPVPEVTIGSLALPSVETYYTINVLKQSHANTASLQQWHHSNSSNDGGGYKKERGCLVHKDKESARYNHVHPCNFAKD